jgi:DNA repair exonuclease SbcCD ATPase subunit
VIRRIRLQHWRAYDQLDLSLTHPVTFLVAPNGVGKSSLVEAVRWGLLGTPPDRARGRAVRGGHDEASVTLLVSLPNQADIEVTRTLRRSGSVTFAATIDGKSLTEAEYEATLTEAWTADTALLDAVIFGPAAVGKVTGFPIRDHLATVFGVEPLLRSAAYLKSRRDAIATQIKSLREDLSGTTEAIEAARRRVTELEATVAAAQRDREAAAARVSELDTSATQASAWHRYRDAAADYRTRTQSLISEMADTIAVSGDDPRASLAPTRQRVAAALEASIAAAGDAEVRVARSAGAADLLSVATGRCPTCLRPLSEHERDAALAAHGRDGGGAREDIVHHEQQTARLRKELAVIARFSDDFAQLSPPVEPSHSDPGPQAVDLLREARERADNLAQVHGGLLARLDVARREVEQFQAAAADQANLTRLAREDLLLDVAHRSVTKVADRYLTERVAPLATQIGHRWKLLFGSDGLHLRPDGQLHVGHAEIDLALSDLSGGERATALLVTRLMLAASATRASSLWLDEPLEHLDPVRRAGVAATLVRAAQSESIDQILVTTYEEGLARRLEATAPDVVKLTYVRSTSERDPV